MNLDKQIKIELNIRTAIAIFQVLYKEQENYSLVHTPKRIIDIRAVINQINDQLNENID